jgi:tRNA (guanine37-N1)-methyltransferase
MVTLKQALSTKLTEKELSALKTAFDMVGDIAIIEIPDELISKEKIIAETLLSLVKTIKVVCKKVGIHGGQFRTQQLKVIAGEDRKTTIYKENNCMFKLNPELVYFSPRLSTERKRIYQLIKPGESILVMFSGVAPYPCVIAKNSKPKEIYGIEINPEAHKFALENIKLNKLKNVTLFNGDVNDVLPTIKKKFDRILMPLPKNAGDFLDIALTKAKKNTIIHFYDFLQEHEFNQATEKVDTACKRAKKKYKILQLVKCGKHAPFTYRICLDFQII